MKIVQKQENRIAKRLNNMQCLEAKESNVMVNGWHFSGNVDSIPLKKRRLVYRSLPPPLQSSNSITESDGLVVGQCVSDQYTHLNFTTESNDASGSGNDFSGIAILAAAACSDRIDISTDDAGKSQVQMGGLLDVEDAECSNSVCAMDSPKDNAQVVSKNNDANDAGMTLVSESQFVAVTSVNKESVECVNLFKLNRNDDAHVNKESLADFPNEVADKSRENSSSTRDYRFHWDLNTAVDDELCVDSSTCFVEVPPKNIMESQNLDNEEDSQAKGYEIQNLEDGEGLGAKRFEATEKGERVTSQLEACKEAECLGLPNNANFISVLSTASKMEYCSELSSGFETNIIKETFSTSNSDNHVVGTSVSDTDSAIQPELVSEDATIDHSLSLGLNGTQKPAAKATFNGTGFDIVNEVAEEIICSMQPMQSKEHGIGFLLTPFAEHALYEGKDADCKNVEDFKDSKGPSNNKVTSVTFQPTATKSLDSCKCEIAASLESGEVSCKVNDLDPKIPEASDNLISLVDCEVKHGGVIGLPLECQPSCSESQMGELKHSIVSLCTTKLEDMITTSMTLGYDRAIGGVITEELEEKPTVRYVSESDPFNDHKFDSLVPKTLSGNVDVDVSSKPTGGHLVQDSLRIGRKPYISNDDSSQVGKNAGMVTEMETGYESHLEDGELKESHCWEDNEGEEGDTEHVDYDSDNRDGAVSYEAAKDSVQFSGEVLVGEGEKNSFQPDTISSVDKPNPDLSVEDNCSFKFQVCVSTVDTLEAVCTNRKSLSLKACSVANDSKKVETTRTDRSSVEVHSTGNDVDDEPPRNAIGASASGRDPQISDRIYADSMRRSSSGNFDCMHDGDGPDESLTRSQRSLHGIGRFGGRSWNPDVKSIVAKSTSEDDGERILIGSGDTSPLRGHKPRIINTSRGGCHFVRRGLPGERDSKYAMGMVKARDMSPDYNQRIRFERSNGISRGGFREGYCRPGVYEGPKSDGDGPMLNRFSRRDRSFSPVGDRFRRKPRSRSRTRSPDFKCEGRMRRGRLPFQQANHSAEHTRERRSPARFFNQGQRFDVNDSPGRLRSDDCVRSNMRTIRFHDATTSGRGHDFEEGDDFRRKPFLRNHRRSRSRSRSCSPDFRPDARMSSMRVPFQPSGDQIRDRRSLVRVFRPDQRYDGRGSPVRLRSDDCLRPMRRPIRFVDSTQPGRGHEYNNNSNNSSDEYRRKPRNIFDRIHPIRHDVEGDSRRFQFDNDEALPNQNFRRNDNFVRGGERKRPVEFNRGPRQERGNIRYNSERMFHSGPKQFGSMREYGSEDGRPRRIGP
ncbi:uncharacterized protein LOC130806686 isoform X2 [Amaranthus tricolor]|uniref:uncharacterized protein LOC130806686 isoform X2 n=1 Tax=Amaranthus tricolor TaxID=29722 RepID=UPI0025878EBF|nr:uncharacterized protein LOC130806686 isoform X2 [Amaranthus tricolor]